MGNNHTLVSRGFRIVLNALAPYIARELGNSIGTDWWQKAVIGILYEDQKRDLPLAGEWGELVDSLDIQRALLLFDLHWNNVFRKKLSIDHRTWAKELVGIRNRLAHLGGEDFTADNTWRALDTMSRLVEQIDSEGAEEIREILRVSRYGSVNSSTTVKAASMPPPMTTKQKDTGILNTAPFRGLPGWRDVIEPHPDVARGSYKNAEFAADLAQVARGEGSYEYRDPVEFFGRTYITEGMAGLLEQSLCRICNRGGEPVIQLKTAFGGGKTHSMLALYHMVRGMVSIDKIPVIKPVMQKAGISTLPKANVAVLVGTALNPTKSKRPSNMPGITINTYWGEMAAQLALSAGDLGLYDYVKEADKKGVSPGSVALRNLFDAAAPCLILMDEIVAYARKIYGVSGLPAGSFDNFITFVQEVTEAVRASKNSLVVAAIPESDIEIGGEAGKIVLETIEHTFGRMESIWKPVVASEGFEVVRRRLFLDCKDPDGRDAVCAKFTQMYNENQSDFPLEAKEVEYKKRMVSCYPIHPEVFDRLYEDWATLDRFQRTRGVLRLMAAVIYELWMGNDASLMIMPGTIPLDKPNVREELTRHLSEGWNALVDREVDGKNSVPYQKDQTNPRYGGKLAARRVARTVMLGSAPTVRDQNVRGIEASRIRLGVVQPGENIANFNDALSTLTSSLAYLYTNPSGDRFWYDTRPTLRKTVADRATQIPAPEVELEIEKRLRKLHKEQPFAGVHACPASSLDVPDEQSARLVILCPGDKYKASRQDNSAMIEAVNILNNRGNTPRIYRNMLAFIAPDQDLMDSLQQAVRLYLAWSSIKDDSEDLNLDAAQNRETKNNLERSDETVDARIKETYCWLLVPYIDKNVEMKTIIWDSIRISGGAEGIITKAAKKMLQNEAIITAWAPALLLMELDNLLWRDVDNISIKKLWEYLCTYCYLPRLAGESVLEETIRTGLNSPEYFAFASALDGDRYIGLKFNQYVGIIERSGYLVKVDVAQKQLAAEAVKAGEENGTTHPTGTNAGEPSTYIITTPGVKPEAHDPAVTVPQNTHFYMSADLDTTRIGRDVQKLVEEVISHLTSVDGAQVEISLEVNVKSPDGLSPQTVRTVSENCQTLKVRSFGFDE
ncbi:MAG TPA: ATP-binding protein [Firmicutes bacterium]|nr:ATP-binding protein [Bacillota bacterium]